MPRPPKKPSYVLVTHLFGLSSAPQIFNNWIRRILEGIPNQTSASDDISVMDHSLEELRHHVDLVLSRLEEVGLTVNVNNVNLKRLR